MADVRNARSGLSRERFINPEQASVHLYPYQVPASSAPLSSVRRKAPWT